MRVMCLRFMTPETDVEPPVTYVKDIEGVQVTADPRHCAFFVYAGSAVSTKTHPFKGRHDRWCEICNRPDRDPIHDSAGPKKITGSPAVMADSWSCDIFITRDLNKAIRTAKAWSEILLREDGYVAISIDPDFFMHTYGWRVELRIPVDKEGI